MRSELRIAALLSLAGWFACAFITAQQPAPYRLTLHDAIQKALQANLTVLVAGTKVDEAEATRQRRLAAALLPRVNAQAYANVQNRNLRAFGISSPGIPDVVGPFPTTIFASMRSRTLSISKAVAP
jgi:outer membrane protein TolC